MTGPTQLRERDFGAEGERMALAPQPKATALTEET
jgi:hypothetical protein